MTNLIIYPRSGPDPTTGYRFFVRGAPGTESFDGAQAMVNIRAKLTEPLSNPGVAQNMTVYARDLDGSDTNVDTTVGPVVIPADPTGADEYSFSVALNQFNTTSFTTVSVPLAQFTLNNVPMGGNPVGALFANPGDGLLTDFNLFEFGALVPNGGGLVRLEMEYMELVLPPASDADFDNSGLVDGNDFLIWQRGIGKPGTAANGDANGDGQVNGADLTIIRSKLVGPPSTTTSGAAPEPTGGLLAAMAAIASIRRRRA
jgi:MYXO-CTERM domain-containing protein